MFYDRLIEVCSTKNISLTNVLKEINVHPSTATYWKRGKNPTVEILVKLSRYFNVSTDYLLGICDVKNPTSKKSKVLDISTLSNSSVKQLKQYVEFLKNNK